MARKKVKPDGDAKYGYKTEAEEQLMDLEYRFFKNFVAPQFTMDQLIDFVVPKETRDILATAGKYAAAQENTIVTFTVKGLEYKDPYDTKTGDEEDGRSYDLRLFLDFRNAGLLAPSEAALYLDENAAVVPGLRTLVADSWDVFCRFNRVRKVVRWLQDEQVTYAAAKGLWPQIVALCPNNKELAAADGERYKTPDNHGQMVETLRETQSTITSAIMAPKIERPNANIVGPPKLALRFTSSGPDSQIFDLI